MRDLLESSLPAGLREAAWRVAAMAEASHIPAYLVGGPVRDLLVGRPVAELDVVVEGDAIDLARRLEKSHRGKVTAHPKFATATWTIDSMEVDLVTARSERYESPGALPSIQPGNIEADLRRRDFSINAMALRLDGAQLGELLDPVLGQADLQSKQIRALHDRSFVDDPTRMLRAARYAERYGFSIHTATLKLVDAAARRVLAGLSGERLRHELDLIFNEEKPASILRRLAELDLLTPIHTSLSTVNLQLSTFRAPPSDWGEFKTPEILSVQQSLGWISWLLQLRAADVAWIAERLAFPAILRDSAVAAASLAAELGSLQNARPSQWTSHLDGLPALAVYGVYLHTQSPALKDYLSKWRHIRPHTSGEDLKARGLPPGPSYQRVLSRLRAAWIDGEVNSASEEQDLLTRALSDS